MPSAIFPQSNFLTTMPLYPAFLFPDTQLHLMVWPIACLVCTIARSAAESHACVLATADVTFAPFTPWGPT